MLRESKESYIIQAEMRIQITTGLNFKMYLRGTLKKKKLHYKVITTQRTTPIKK